MENWEENAVNIVMLSPTTDSTTILHILRLVHSSVATPEEEERQEPLLSSESEPQVSESAVAHSESPVFGSPSDISRRVQFQIGTASDVSSQMYEFLLPVLLLCPEDEVL